MATNPKTVQYIDFGYPSAADFWNDVVVPANARYASDPTRRHAIEVSFSAWHVVDWLFHEQRPAVALAEFQRKRIGECPELGWIRDVCDAGKHRGLSLRVPAVQRVGKGVRPVSFTNNAGEIITFVNDASQPVQFTAEGPLEIELADKSRHAFAVVLGVVMDYWRTNWFKP